MNYRKTQYSLILFAFGLIYGTSAVAQTLSSPPKASSQWLSSWESLEEEDGVSGLQRQHKSKIYQYKMNALIDANAATIAALLLDGNGVASWAPGTLSSEEIERADDESRNVVYATYHFPGAVNRDSLIESTARYNPENGEIKINFKSLNKKGPKKDLRLVRFPLVAGSWTLRPTADGQTHVTHLNLALPGGIVQDNLFYVYNIGARQSAFDTLKALGKAVDNDKYRHTSLVFLRDSRDEQAYLSKH